MPSAGTGLAATGPSPWGTATGLGLIQLGMIITWAEERLRRNRRAALVTSRYVPKHRRGDR
jgi:hypothetical protein